MESDKPCKSSSTSNFPSKKEERPKKFKGEDHKRTLYKMYYSGTGRDLWRTSDVVPRSEVALAKPDPFLTLVFSRTGAQWSAESYEGVTYVTLNLNLQVQGASNGMFQGSHGKKASIFFTNWTTWKKSALLNFQW